MTARMMISTSTITARMMIRAYLYQHHDSQNGDQNLSEPAPWQPEWWSEPISTSTMTEWRSEPIWTSTMTARMVIRAYLNQHHDSQIDDQNLYQLAPWQPEWWSEPISTSTMTARMVIRTYINQHHDRMMIRTCLNQHHDSQNGDQNLYQPAPWQPEWWSEPISTSTMTEWWSEPISASTMTARLMIRTYIN